MPLMFVAGSLMLALLTAAEAPELEEQVRVVESRPAGEDPAAFSTRLDGEEITSRGQDLADVLRRVPGARVRDYGGLGGYATISLRASTAEQVTILVDGVPQNRALGGPVDLSSIAATQVDAITVFRGFGPASLGLGGVGGVVDIRTKPVAPTVGGQVDLLAGQLGTGRASAAISIPTGETSGFRIDAEALTSDGDFVFRDTGGTYFTDLDDTERRRENNAVDGLALLVQHAWETIGPHRVRVGLRLQDRERGVPWVDNLPTSTARTEDRLADLTVTWSRRGRGRIDDTEVVLNGFDQRMRFADPDANFGVATDRRTEATGVGIGGVLRASIAAHRLSARIDVRTEDATVRDTELIAEDRGGAERLLAGVTVEDTVSFGRWVLAPSVRWDYRRDDFVPAGGGALPPPADDVRDDGWSAKLGVARMMSPRTTVRGSVGSFYRAPNLRELFGNRGALRGNPNLDSERGNALELGATHDGARGAARYRFELAGFGRRTDDLIHFRQQSQGVAVAVNLLRTEVVGLETAGGLRLGNGVYGDLSVTWQRDVWRVGWEMTYTGSNSTDEFDTPALRLDARVIHDLVAGYESKRGLRLTLDLRNVFDRKTVDVARYPLPDRTLLFHAGWRYGSMR
jgi:outer membrane receptor protein involved in Fe transport